MTETWKKLEGQAVNGEFHLRKYLGGSDHSAVFLTEHGQRGSQKAAIKLIPADPQTADLQLSRWELAAKLSNPNLIRLLQMGRCELEKTALLFVVMEYAEEDLSQILPQRPLTPEETREMLKPVLNALAYLHGKGVVQGRIKPANIMAIADQIKISSDGLCRVGEENDELEPPSAYDPPAAGGRASTAGDIWSLGMTLVETLTQRLPTWDRTERDDPELPQTLPAPFQEIARNCLYRDAQRRWTLADIAARLQPVSAAAAAQVSATAAAQVPARQPAPAVQTASQVRITARQPKPLAPQRPFTRSRYMAPAVIVVLGLAAIFVAPRFRERRPEPPPTPSSLREAPLAGPKSAPKAATPVPKPARQKPSDATRSYVGVAPLSPASPSIVEAKAPAHEREPGEVLEQVLPEISQEARNTIRGTVRVSVKVSVDPSGNLTKAGLESPGPSRYFAGLALRAAQSWEFAPAKVDGHSVPSEWILRFQFTNTDTRVFPEETAP